MLYRYRNGNPHNEPVEAIQWNGSRDITDVMEFAGKGGDPDRVWVMDSATAVLLAIRNVHARGGYRLAYPDDWIVRKMDGSLYPIRATDFASRFEEIKPSGGDAKLRDSLADAHATIEDLKRDRDSLQRRVDRLLVKVGEFERAGSNLLRRLEASERELVCAHDARRIAENALQERSAELQRMIAKKDDEIMDLQHSAANLAEYVAKMRQRIDNLVASMSPPRT